MTAGNMSAFAGYIFTHAKEKASAKHAGVGLEFASEASKKNREAVDIFGRK